MIAIRLVPYCLCTAFLLSSTAHAALTNCSNLNLNPGDYKVVLDELAFGSQLAKNNADLAALKERLQFNLNGQLDALKASAKKLNQNLQVPLRVVTCVGRQPSLNGDEFTDELAEHLSDERVVVEMWGTLDLKIVSGANASPRAMIGYVIPPVQRYVANEAPAIQVLVYPKSGNVRSAEELENLPELSAFALVGLGTKATRASHYDLAVWAFTRAESGILDAQLGGSTEQLDALLAYVRHAACTTRARARTDQNYSGSLKLLPPQICTGAP
jgi:hypothetical protein